MRSDVSIGGRASPWLPPLRRRPDARLRLFCFPHAGGSAAGFVSWADRLPATIDVRPLQLPGRSVRLHEPPLTSLADIVAAVGREIRPLLDRPFAFFGHSMGAIVAFELAHHLWRWASVLPVRLAVSGRRAPQIPSTDLPPADLPDAELWEYIRRLNGTPSEVLASAELRDLVLSTLRADFEVCRSYRYMPRPPLSCPITVFGGAADEESAEDYLERWSVHTTGTCAVVRFPGDHFYLHSADAPLLRMLGGALQRATDNSSCALPPGL